MIKTTRGRVGTAIKALVYGVHGIGKTTFASKWPSPLFIDVEGSSEQLENDDIVRVDPAPVTYREFLSVIDQLQADCGEFRTLVIDTADWLEGMIIRQICQDEKISSIEKYGKGYGKGWVKVAETWAELLDKLDRLRKTRGVNILFVAHSQVKKFEPVDDIAYDRYILCQKDKTGEMLKNWADLMLFAKHEILVTENEDGKARAVSNGKRVMYTNFSPCWDAKNRFNLPEKLPFDFNSIKNIFKAPAVTMEVPVSPAAPAPAAPAPEVPQEVEAPAAGGIDPNSDLVPPRAIAPEIAGLLTQLENLMKIDNIAYGELTAMVEKKGIVPAGTELRNYNKQTLTRIIAGWTAVKNNIELARKG